MDNKAVSFCSEILFITYTSRLLCMRWGIRIQGNSLEIRSALLNVISQTTALFPFVTSILFFFFFTFVSAERVVTHHPSFKLFRLNYSALRYVLWSGRSKTNETLCLILKSFLVPVQVRGVLTILVEKKKRKRKRNKTGN